MAAGESIPVLRPDLLSRVKGTYLAGVVWAAIAIGAMALWQARGTLSSNESIWLGLAFLALGLVNLRAALVVLIALLTITPAFHTQLNALVGTNVAAWPYPGADAVVGLLAAWTLRGRVLASSIALASRFPSTGFVLLHAWISASTVLTVSHNVWRTASSVDWNGIKINLRTVRGLSWHDDFFALQDWFYYSASIALLLLVLQLLSIGGRRLLIQLIAAFIAGSVCNATFALWQDWTDLGWVNGVIGFSVNAFWPDLHSFGALMVVTIGLSIGWLYADPPSKKVKSVLFLASGLAFLGLLSSTSRFPILVLLATAIGVSVWNAFTSAGKWRFAPLSVVIAFTLFSAWTLKQGYRGFTYATFAPLFETFEPEKLNFILAYRPEIWAAAVRMYSSFPFSGLGQGGFGGLSGIMSFSGSEALARLGGEGAHNYFLQTFVELGPVGALLILLTLVPMWRVGRINITLVTFYGLVGIAIGNVYAHALLVREMLLLAAALLAMYYWEAASAVPASIAPLSPRVRTVVFALCVITLGLASYEAAASFHRFPFNYGQRCHEPKQWSDGWSSGLVRETIGPDVRRIDAALSWPRRDLDRRPLIIEAQVLAPDGSVVARRTLQADRPQIRLVPIAFDLPADGSARTLTIQANHCYVPLNLGDAYDPRPLGFRIPLLRFTDGGGRSVPLLE